ncbi:hypothetical protein RhiTH_011646 [Rhizoctonia solani]
MSKSKQSCTNKQLSLWQNHITEDLFKGLKTCPNGSEEAVRNAPIPDESLRRRKRKSGRERLAKTENDMIRKMLDAVTKALNNTIQLDFYLSEFELQRTRGIGVHTAGAFKGLDKEPIRLTRSGGPAVLTDKAGIPILWYFPDFIGKGLQTNLMRTVASLASVYRPAPDSEICDRRTTLPQLVQDDPHSSKARYATRSQTSRAALHMPEDPEVHSTSQEEPIDFSPCTMEEPAYVPDNQLVPPAYEEVDGEITIAGHYTPSLSLHQSSDSVPDDQGSALADLSSFAYYLSPGWSQTGMQYKKPIQMLVHLRGALLEATSETIAFLKAKRLFDKQIIELTDIIQPSLSQSLRKLKAHMSAIQGPTGTTVTNGWTSAFPCYGVAVNRTTGMHRDSKGIRAGLDIIGVLGTFNSGGDLELPDLNLRLEWTPGVLGAFDGYDFRHMVHEWTGGSRVALISFCRQSTWTALGLTPDVSRPTVAQCRGQLESAKERRAARQQAHLELQEETSGMRETKKLKFYSAQASSEADGP